jgi:alpha-galactosidase
MKHGKVVLIGAGSASFTVGLIADLLISNIAEEWTVGLVDINERALGVAKGLVERMVEKKNAPVTVEASLDRCDVLPGADIVVTTIAVGGRPAWEADVVIPREHGIFQPVGDTICAGGISRALRQIPPMLDIARDVARLCPNAYFFNYGNPMAAITRAVNKATPATLTGLCHGVQGTLRHLCNFIGVPYSEISSLYVGMNHLTWITHFTRQGEDLWPLVNAKLLSDPPQDNPVTWELYRSFGAFPAVLDRHITEFFSERYMRGTYYGKRLGLDEIEILGTIRGGEERYEHMAAQAEGREPLEDSLFERTLGEHEALIPILESMFADEQKLFPMNTPNQTVKGIPEGFVLEMPTVAARAGCLPVAMPPIKPSLLAIISEALWNVELTVEAALTGDRKLFIEALLYDGCVGDLAAATALADDLLTAHKEHLPQFA